MTNEDRPEPDSKQNPAEQIADALLNFIGQIPRSSEPATQEPGNRARTVANAAAAKAALTAGTLALPPGPLGWLTILPEMVAVWKIQAQMVSDIAAIYGQTAMLSREQMIYCLFRHMAAQVVRDLVARVGDRLLTRRIPLQALQAIARKIGVRVSQRTVGKGIARWLPIVGALGVGAYAYFDTGQVATTAIELFEQKLEIEPGWN